MTTQHRDLRTGQPIWFGKRTPRIQTNLLLESGTGDPDEDVFAFK